MRYFLKDLCPKNFKKSPNLVTLESIKKVVLSVRIGSIIIIIRCFDQTAVSHYSAAPAEHTIISTFLNLIDTAAKRGKKGYT